MISEVNLRVYIYRFILCALSKFLEIMDFNQISYKKDDYGRIFGENEQYLWFSRGISKWVNWRMGL